MAPRKKKALEERKTADAVELGVCDLQLRDVNVEGRFADFVCSTGTEDSHGTIIEQKWRLERYLKNPTVLYAHNRLGGDGMPIGKASMVRVDGDALCARVTLLSSRANPLTDQILAQWGEGSLRAISVGFYPNEYRWEKRENREVLVLSDNELRELSIVPVGSNPDCLARIHERALTERQITKAAPGRETEQMDYEKECLRLRGLLDESTTAATSKDRELVSERAKAATLDAECKRLGAELTAVTARAVAAEDLVVRGEIEGAFGKNVEPAEADHLVALHRAAPELFKAEMKRRSGRNDKLGERAIPAEPKEGAARSTGDARAAQEAEEQAVLERHMKGGV
jgi:HK97 family phage prohead protease